MLPLLGQNLHWGIFRTLERRGSLEGGPIFYPSLQFSRSYTQFRYYFSVYSFGNPRIWNLLVLGGNPRVVTRDSQWILGFIIGEMNVKLWIRKLLQFGWIVARSLHVVLNYWRSLYIWHLIVWENLAWLGMFVNVHFVASSLEVFNVDDLFGWTIEAARGLNVVLLTCRLLRVSSQML